MADSSEEYLDSLLNSVNGKGDDFFAKAGIKEPPENADPADLFDYYAAKATGDYETYGFKMPETPAVDAEDSSASISATENSEEVSMDVANEEIAEESITQDTQEVVNEEIAQEPIDKAIDEIVEEPINVAEEETAESPVEEIPSEDSYSLEDLLPVEEDSAQGDFVQDNFIQEESSLEEDGLSDSTAEELDEDEVHIDDLLAELNDGELLDHSEDSVDSLDAASDLNDFMSSGEMDGVLGEDSPISEGFASTGDDLLDDIMSDASLSDVNSSWDSDMDMSLSDIPSDSTEMDDSLEELLKPTESKAEEKKRKKEEAKKKKEEEKAKKAAQKAEAKDRKKAAKEEKKPKDETASTDDNSAGTVSDIEGSDTDAMSAGELFDDLAAFDMQDEMGVSLDADAIPEKEPSDKKGGKKGKGKKAKKDKTAESEGEKKGLFAGLFGSLFEEEEEEEAASDENQAIIDAVAGEESETAIPEKGKGKKDKKGKDKKNKKGKGSEEDGEEVDTKKKKPKKEKKKPEQEEEQKPQKKIPKGKIIRVFVVCITLMVLIIVASTVIPSKLNVQKGRDAYYGGDYETVYECFMGESLSESDQLIYQRAVFSLALSNKLDSYVILKATGENMKALNELFSAVRFYQKQYDYARQIDALSDMAMPYQKILDEFLRSYGLNREKVEYIAGLSDLEYNRQLYLLITGKEFTIEGYESSVNLDSVQATYDDLLPEEADINMDGENDDSGN